MQHPFARRAALGLAVALGLYALAGFALAPRMLEKRLIQALGEHVGQPVEIGWLRYNPFTATARFGDLAAGGSATPALSVAAGTLGILPASLLRRGGRLRSVTLDAPLIRLTDANLPPPAALLAARPAWRADRVEIRDGTAILVTGARTHRMSAIALHAVGEGPQAVTFDLEGTIDGEGSLTVRGERAGERLDATLRLYGVEVGRLDRRLPAQPAVRLARGTLDFYGALRVAAGDTGVEGTVTLTDVALEDADSGETLLTAREVRGDEVWLGGSPVRLDAQSVSLAGPVLRLTRDADGAWQSADWLKALASGPARVVPWAQHLQVSEGRIGWMDQRVTPPVVADVVGIEGGLDDGCPGGPCLALRGRLGEAGRAELRASWRDAQDDTGPDTWSVSLQALAAAQVSPYLERLADHRIEGGDLDVAVAGARAGSGQALALTARLGEARVVAPGDEAAGAAPLALATALLRDRNDALRLMLVLPAGADPAGALRARLAALSTAPWAALGTAAGVEDADVGRVRFAPGNAALDSAASERLERTAAALRERPALAVDVPAHFDPRNDRDALAHRQVRMHVALATSAVPPGAAVEPRAPDFDDLRVRSVLEEFAGERLRAATLEGLRSAHPRRGTLYFAAVYEALVETEPVPERTLKNLGRFRALSIVAGLRAAGIDPARLHSGAPEPIALSAAAAAEVTVTLGVRACPGALPCIAAE